MHKPNYNTTSAAPVIRTTRTSAVQFKIPIPLPRPIPKAATLMEPLRHSTNKGTIPVAKIKCRQLISNAVACMTQPAHSNHLIRTVQSKDPATQKHATNTISTNSKKISIMLSVIIKPPQPTISLSPHSALPQKLSRNKKRYVNANSQKMKQNSKPSALNVTKADTKKSSSKLLKEWSDKTKWITKE